MDHGRTFFEALDLERPDVVARPDHANSMLFAEAMSPESWGALREAVHHESGGPKVAYRTKETE
jgi:hypothetical protein